MCHCLSLCFASFIDLGCRKRSSWEKEESQDRDEDLDVSIVLLHDVNPDEVCQMKLFSWWSISLLFLVCLMMMPSGERIFSWSRRFTLNVTRRLREIWWMARSASISFNQTSIRKYDECSIGLWKQDVEMRPSSLRRGKNKSQHDFHSLTAGLTTISLSRRRCLWFTCFRMNASWGNNKTLWIFLLKKSKRLWPDSMKREANRKAINSNSFKDCFQFFLTLRFLCRLFLAHKCKRYIATLSFLQLSRDYHGLT